MARVYQDGFNEYQSQVKWTDKSAIVKDIPQGRSTQEFRKEAIIPVVEDKTYCHEAARRL